MSERTAAGPPKRKGPTACPWCGTAFRHRLSRCPRGPQCARDEREHNRIMALITGSRV